MMIVGREAVVLVVVGIVGGGLPVGDALAERLVVQAAREVGVDLVGEGRDEIEDLGLRLADLRPHEERNDVAVRAAAQLHAVDAALQVLRHREAEVVGPAAVVQVVVVEMDRAVVMRRALPVALGAGPGRALHRARRQVDQLAVQAVGAGVLDLHRLHAAGEIPGRDAGDRRRLDLAVEAALRRPVAGRPPRRSGSAARRRARAAPAPSCWPRPRRRRQRRASAAAGRPAACRCAGRRSPRRDTRCERAASCRPTTWASPHLSTMPSGVSTSAKPAPVLRVAARDHGLRSVGRAGSARSALRPTAPAAASRPRPRPCA